MADSTFIRRVRIKNYRSVEECDFALISLAFLVGPNGSGKSNIVDAMAFVADALRSSLEAAVSQRDGVGSLLRRGGSGRRAESFMIELHYTIGAGHGGIYELQVGAQDDGSPYIVKERCTVSSASMLGHSEPYEYEVTGGKVRANVPQIDGATVKPDRLYLPAAAYDSKFQPPFDTLQEMAAYHIDPRELRIPRKQESGNLLKRCGENLSSLLGAPYFAQHGQLGRIQQYLEAMVPGVFYVGAGDIGGMKSLRFHQRVGGENLEFYGASMSDGTLRAVGILAALFQPPHAARLVLVEEPELALHPAAAGVLLDALREASTARQVLATTHSPELLDDTSIAPESLLAVDLVEGKTVVAPISPVLQERLRRRLSTPGQLLRQNQVHPNGHDTVEISL